MSSLTARSALVGAVVALGLASACPVFAQASNDTRPSFSLNAGASQFDLSGTGVAPIAAARVDLPLNRVLIAEGGVSFMRTSEQFNQHVSYLVPEAQLQAQLPLGRVHPYIGAGVGYLSGINAPAWVSDATFSASVGTRFALTSVVGLQAELRVRGVSTDFTGGAAEWTGGMSWRF